ncbi:hypothetical protein HK096_009412 [Nowakowskiella sp. JEL0078]|nr:hypothetical protein HK096_009412 [Nowakowskiella sp. JEL0078]
MKTGIFITLLSLVILAAAHSNSHEHHDHHGHDHHHHHATYQDHTHEEHQAIPDKIDNNHNHYESHNVLFLPKFFADQPIITTFLVLSVISTIPILIATVIPSQISPVILNVFVSVAVGSVLADVFLHQLPEIMGGAAVAEAASKTLNDNHYHEHEVHNHHHSVAAMRVGIYVLAGIISFFTLERIIASFGNEHNHSHEYGHHEHNHLQEKHDHHHDQDHDHHHSHDVAEKELQKNDSIETLNENEISPKIRRRKNVEKKKDLSQNFDEDDKKKTQTSTAQATFQFTHAYLHTIAGATHCFTDGLTVSLSFITSPSAGFATAFAVLLHEIPHKLGDYAILRGTGLSKQIALKFMAFGSIGSFLGASFGALVWWYANSTLGNFEFIHNKIMPFASGGLVYLALVGVLPELTHTPVGIKGLTVTLLNLVGMIGGVAMMANIGH